MGERRFGKRTFRIDPPLATQALVMQARLMQILGPAVDKLPLIFAARREGASEEAKLAGVQAAGAALAGIAAQIEPTRYAALAGDLIGMAKVMGANGKYEQADIDTDFSSYQQDLYPVMGWVIQEVFGGFFTDLLGNGSPKTAAAA